MKTRPTPDAVLFTEDSVVVVEAKRLGAKTMAPDTVPEVLLRVAAAERLAHLTGKRPIVLALGDEFKSDLADQVWARFANGFVVTSWVDAGRASDVDEAPGVDNATKVATLLGPDDPICRELRNGGLDGLRSRIVTVSWSGMSDAIAAAAASLRATKGNAYDGAWRRARGFWVLRAEGAR